MGSSADLGWGLKRWRGSSDCVFQLVAKKGGYQVWGFLNNHED